MKIRIKFRKFGMMKFIGHLDIMRYFQKALRRAEIPVCYSGGFSPHIKMSFAQPLGVGVTSDGEYLDVEVEDSLSLADGIRRLNAVMAEGIEVTSVRRIPEEKSQNAMSLVAAADYTVRFAPGKEPKDWQGRFAEFLRQPEIFVLKKSKKSEQEMDIRPYIYSSRIENDAIFLRLAAGSLVNIKPELIMEAFCQYLGQPLEKFSLQMHRAELYARAEGTENFLSLEELGQEF